MIGEETKQRGPAVMCLLALAVGCVAGVGAWFFRCLIGLFHNLLFLGSIYTLKLLCCVKTPRSFD